MEKQIRNNDSIFLETGNLIKKYESFFVDNQDKNSMKPEWNYLNAVFYCGTVFTTIGKFKKSRNAISHYHSIDLSWNRLHLFTSLNNKLL